MMKRFARHILLPAILLILGTLSAAAQNVQVLCQPYVGVGSKFTVTFRTNIDGNISTPQIKGCKYIFGPAMSSRQSSSIIISNGQTQSSHSSTIEYTFTYKALTPGRAVIPSVTVSDGHRTARSVAKSFEITQRNASAQTGFDEDDDNANTAVINQQSTASSVNPKDLIVVTSLSKSDVYEQEAVIATIKVYTKLNIRSFRATTLPEYEGFISEDLPVPNKRSIEHFRGENYYTAVLKRSLLYPKTSGVLRINSGRYEVTVETLERITMGSFITTRTIPHNITTVSNETSVKVLPLPEPRPEGFNGAVGVYRISTSLEPKELRTNEPATYTFSISGTGNLKTLAAPEFAMPKGVDTFTPESKVDAQFNGSDMTGTFTATYNFVPQQTGTLTVPSWKFVYFDPQSRKYVTVNIPEYSRPVAKGSAAASQSDIAHMTDIEHIIPVGADRLSKEMDSIVRSPMYILAYIIAILMLVTAAVIYRRQLNFRADVIGRRTAHASRVATRRLRLARKAMNEHHNEQFYALLAKALWGYISDKLQIPASELTRDNIAERLGSYGADQALVDKTIAILDDCEMARFTPAHSDTEVSALYKTATDVINALESVRRVKTRDKAEDLAAINQHPE